MGGLSRYAGVYAAPTGRMFGVEVADRAGEDSALVLLDVDTGRLRRLSPEGDHSFTAGPTFSLSAPIGWRLEFQMASPRAAGVSVFETGRAPATASRVSSPPRVVAFANGEIRLEGDLHLPATPEPHPLLVWVHGSSAATRRGLMGLPQIFARFGFAVFAYDKRGCGASQGDYLTVGFDDLAADAAAAVDAACAQPEVDAGRVAVLGTSQGGWIAFRAAQLSPRIRAIINWYGTPTTVADQMLYDLSRKLEAQGADPAARTEALDLQRRVNACLAGKAPLEATLAHWEAAGEAAWRPLIFTSYAGHLDADALTSGVAKMLRHDPVPDVQAFRGSLLYLVGGFDRLVDPDGAIARYAELLAPGCADVTLLKIPNAHHGLFAGEHGGADEGFRGLGLSPKLDGFAPGVLEITLRWLAQRFGCAAA